MTPRLCRQPPMDSQDSKPALVRGHGCPCPADTGRMPTPAAVDGRPTHRRRPGLHGTGAVVSAADGRPDGTAALSADCVIHVRLTRGRRQCRQRPEAGQHSDAGLDAMPPGCVSAADGRRRDQGGTVRGHGCPCPAVTGRTPTPAAAVGRPRHRRRQGLHGTGAVRQPPMGSEAALRHCLGDCDVHVRLSPGRAAQSAAAQRRLRHRSRPGCDGTGLCCQPPMDGEGGTVGTVRGP